MRRHRLELMVCLILTVATISAFWQVQNHEFVNYDDKRYVTENRHVQAGLTREGLTWTFTTTHASNWHPLTWLSHMLDCQIYGLNPGGHHITSLLFHIVNTLLLFAILKRMTGALWQSAFVAAMFAVHPLHVESVAWVAERKDVLSTFFWMLTMWAYIRYTEHSTLNRYLLVLLPFVLGLMAKPMLVTLPFVLLLMDYWPLGRFQMEQSSDAGIPQSHESKLYRYKRALVLRLIWEKVPLFALAAASCVVTFLAQQSIVWSLDALPLQIRLANALVAYISYIVKMIWPFRLAVIYPHADMLPMWQVIGAGLLLVCISILVIRAVRRSPYLAVGWPWFLGTLVPVIGLVQVGAQSMADRYTYIPLIGLFIIIAWGIADLLARWRYKELVLATSAGLVLLAFVICSWWQVRHWKNSITLFKHTLSVTANNYVAHNNLGLALAEKGRFEEAISHYSQALRINPHNVQAHNNLGLALAMQGMFEEAISHYKKAVALHPLGTKYIPAYVNLGIALRGKGLIDEAILQYEKVVQLKPKDAIARNDLGVCYFEKGWVERAISQFKIAIRIDQSFADAHYNLGIAFGSKGQYDLAFKEMRIARELGSRHQRDSISGRMNGVMPSIPGHP